MNYSNRSCFSFTIPGLDKIFPLSAMPWGLVAICLFSLAIRIFCWYMESTVSRDGILYLNMAEIWYDKGPAGLRLLIRQNIFIPPFFLYLIRVLMHVGFAAETAGIIISISAGTLLPAVIYRIIRVFPSTEEMGLAGALLIAVAPGAVELSTEIQRESLYLLFSGLVIWFMLLALKQRKNIYFVPVGLCIALAVWTRYEALEFLPLAIFGILINLCYQKQTPWQAVQALIICLFSTIGCFLWLALLMQLPLEVVAFYRNRVDLLFLFLFGGSF